MSTQTNIRRRRAGYTLMEVLIALTILAVSMTILLGTQSSAVMRGSMANNTTTASLLARAKMLEIESEVAADGFTENTEMERGDFRNDGYAYFRWEYEIELVEIDDGAADSLLSETNSKLFGEGSDGSGGAFTGNAAFAAYLPMVVGMVPDMINRLGEKVRKVTLTISWEQRGAEQKLTLVQYITDLKADDRAKEGEGAEGNPLDPGGLPPGLKP